MMITSIENYLQRFNVLYNIRQISYEMLLLWLLCFWETYSINPGNHGYLTSIKFNVNEIF